MGQLAANGLVIASFLAEAAYSVIGKPALERSGPFKVLTVALVAGTLLNLLWDGPHLMSQALSFNAKAWGLLLYLSLVCSVFGYGLWLVIIRETPVNVVALTVFVQPMAGLLIAVVWLHEQPHIGQFLGSICILTGLMIGLWKREGAIRQRSREMIDPISSQSVRPAGD